MLHTRARGNVRLAAAALLAWLLPLSAMAGAGRLSTVVEPLADTTTYSRAASAGIPAQVHYIGYEVRVANVGRNSVNHVRFTGAAAGRSKDQPAAFQTSEGIDCVPANAAGTAVDCAIGTLKAGQSVSFRVIFRAPARAPGSTLPAGRFVDGRCKGDCLGFQGITWYAEGMSGPHSRPRNSSLAWAAPLVALAAPDPSKLSTAVLRAGARLYTGISGVTVASDEFATTVDVPPVPSSTVARIVESPFSLAEGCVNFLTCYQSDITIPVPVGSTSFAPYLKIVLRVDAANIRPGRKISEVVPLYDGVPIGLCASRTTPRNDGVPCIAETKVYRKTSKYRTPGWTPELDCDWEWTILNVVNGSYRMP